MTTESRFGGYFSALTDSGDRERVFSVEELFFSTTDERGVILTGNEVFVRVSGYESDELIARPHNVIRHADMPRAVFRLLWQHLQAGEPIMAYVKNRSKDGSHYWVAAAARPITGGHLSVRLKPTTELFAAVRGVYGEMREIEADRERAGHSRTDGMDASTAHLAIRLRELGFRSYDRFMRSALVAEVQSRSDAVRAQWGGRAQGSDSAVRLHALLDEVSRYTSLNRQLGSASEVLVGIAEEGKLLALNGVLASRRVGATGASLVAVTNALQQAFPTMSEHARDVVAHIDQSRANLDRAGFATALAVLQRDMVDAFRTELERSSGSAESEMEQLHDCSRADVDEMKTSLDEMVTSMEATIRAAARLETALHALASIERNGRIEAARTGHADVLAGLFDSVRHRVGQALEHTRDITMLAHELDGLDRATAHAARAVTVSALV